MKKRFSEEQIIGFLREADAGMAVKDLCRRHGFSEASYYLWRSKFGGMSVSDAKRLKAELRRVTEERDLDIPDPYGGPAKGYETAFTQVAELSEQVSEALHRHVGVTDGEQR